VTVIDLRPALRDAKSSSLVYYKTDSHWNTRGAYAAYREILRVLKSEFPEVSAKAWESLRPKPVERTGLDMARMLGRPEWRKPITSSTMPRARQPMSCRFPCLTTSRRSSLRRRASHAATRPATSMP
jgi:hypothetical protein